MAPPPSAKSKAFPSQPLMIRPHAIYLSMYEPTAAMADDGGHRRTRLPSVPSHQARHIAA
eukprot:6360399-Prymnesium_polylepis.1